MKKKINFKRKIKILLFISVIVLSFIPYVTVGILSTIEGNRFSESNFNNIKTASSIKPPDGLVSWWPGDQNPFDIAGVNHGNMKFDATFAPGKVGKAFYFDGVDDYIDVSHDNSLNTVEMTFELWVKPNTIINEFLLYKYTGTPGGFFVRAAMNGGTIKWMYHLSGCVVVSTSTIAVGEWTHLAGTYDGSHLKLYVNGINEASVERTGLYNDNTQNLLIGTSKVVYFDGLMDEITLYNVALGPAEIQAIYNAGEQGKYKSDRELFLPNPVPIITDIKLTHDLRCQGDGLLIMSDGITIDGGCYKLIGIGSGTGLVLIDKQDITITNFIIKDFDTGIIIDGGSNNLITVNYITANNIGISLTSTSDTTITNNIITDNSLGISTGSPNNNIYLNLIINNDDQIRDVGGNTWVHPVHQLGNFWSNYWGKDLDGDGVGDTDLSHEGVDYRPLLDPSIPYRFDLLPFGEDWWSLMVSLVWRGGWSPVDIQMTDSFGRVISRDGNEIGLHSFYVEEVQPDETTNIMVIITVPDQDLALASYSFQMTALDELTYSMNWYAFQEGNTLFERSVEHVPMTAGLLKKVVMNLEEYPSGEIIVLPEPQYTFSGILQPINPDGTSVFKQKSTVPVKFQLFDDLNSPDGTAHATIEIQKISSDIAGDFEEPTSTSVANTGNVFRYDDEEQQYIFNLGTKLLEVGTYLIKIALDDGQIFTVQISLR